MQVGAISGSITVAMRKNMLNLPRPETEEEPEPRDRRLTICLTEEHFERLGKQATGYGRPRATFAAWLVEKYLDALEEGQ